MAKPKPEARNLILEVHREFRRVKAKLEPDLVAQASEPGKGHLANEEFRNIMVAQNVLRPCLEAVFDDLVPFSHLTCMELAIRLASYAISTAPMADQDKLVELVLAGLPNAHSLRLSLGVVIRTGWRDGDEEEKPNFPHAAFQPPQGNA